jgi:hypothetical protein
MANSFGLGKIFLIMLLGFFAMAALLAVNKPLSQYNNPPPAVVPAVQQPAPAVADEEMSQTESVFWAEIITTNGSHAADVHPEVFAMVRSCFDGKHKRWRIPVRDSKYVDICQIDDTTFGFRPFKKVRGVTGTDGMWQELTAYVKDTIHSVDELKEFALQRGMNLLEQAPDGSWVPVNP